jgi:hypothetical protein
MKQNSIVAKYGEFSLKLAVFGFLHLRFRRLTVFKIMRYENGRKL